MYSGEPFFMEKNPLILIHFNLIKILLKAAVIMSIKQQGAN